MRHHATLAFLLVTCGGKTPGTLDPDARIATLSEDEVKQYCDWFAGVYGGYGHAISCEGVQSTGYMDQGTCVSDFMELEAKIPNCPATVGQAETCMQWLAQGACAKGPQPSACTVALSAACSP
jgi:hypothetical protein